MAKILLSLHGFHSSPESLKARQLAEYIDNHQSDITFLCPQLPCLPGQMWKIIESIFEKYKHHDIRVVGSSLGGYLATKVSQVYGSKVILVNPAVMPYRLLQIYAGKQLHPYTHETYHIDENYMQQLKRLDVDVLRSPNKCWVLLQEGDEVLDYQQAMVKYQDCKITCEKDGDHSFVGFERFIPDIIKFLF
tara:strand:- start:14130 stop:14702 length:573 start_codon:yes stop_codon:yes gene_type:complete